MTTLCWNKGTFSPRQTYALTVHSGLVLPTARNKIVEVIAKAGITEPSSETSTEQAIAQLFANLA
jgi:hypothetical protein